MDGTVRRIAVRAAGLGVLLVGLAGQAMAAGGLPFYTPDMIDAQMAEPLAGPMTQAATLPTATPFWADMVDVESVTADGTGVYVAVIDTGLVPQSPFFFSQANIAWGLGKGFTHDVSWDPATQDLAFGPLRDDRGFWTQYGSGHGTHVTSTIVGFNVNNQFWIRGIAPGATIIPVLAIDAWVVDTPYGPIGVEGGSDEMIAAAIHYVADLSEVLDGRVVINMSLGGPDPSPLIEAAVDYAIAKGVLVVASAGNSGAKGLGYPGGLPQIVSVGAAGWASMFEHDWFGDVPEKLNTADVIGNTCQIYLEDFSSRPLMGLGQKHQDLDVSAPGAWVVGPFKPEFTNDLNYYYLSGTSMSSPHVAAIAALVLQGFPNLGQAAMESILESASAGTPLPANDAIVAFPFQAPGWYSATWDGGDYGKGFLRADAALRRAAIRSR